MRKRTRQLRLSRETLLHLDPAVRGDGIVTVIIDPILKTLQTRCPSCELTCAFTCSIDPPSICLPDGCSVRCDQG